MGPVLESLVKLQDVENQLKGTKARLSRIKRVVTLQENQLRSLTSSLEEKNHEIKLLKVEIDSQNIDLKSRDNSLEKYRNALNLAKNNKEYAAILTEINLNKADNSKIESKMLELMKTVEEQEASCSELEKQIQDQQAKVDEVKGESKDKIDEIEKKIAEIEIKWEDAAKGIPVETLLLFQRLSDTYDGEAIANIEKNNPRKKVYTCSGCYMTLTNETVNKLMTIDEVFQCPSCSRIVILNESFEH